MFKNLIVAAALVAISPSLVFAADIFFAFGEDAAATDTATASISDNSGSVFIYSEQGFAFDAADLDFTSDPSVIQFTGGESFNPEFFVPFVGDVIKFNNPDLGTFLSTFNTPATPGMPAMTGGNVIPVNVTEFGVIPAASGFDPSFDEDVRLNNTPEGALLLARVDYDIVGEGIAEFEFTLGTNGVIRLGEGPDPVTEPDLLVTPSLGSAFLTVTEAIPEPSSVALLFLGSIGLVARRQRA